MAPFSNIDQAVYDHEGDDDDVSMASSTSMSPASLTRKSSLSSCSSPSAGHQRKSVVFSNEVAVYYVLHISDYSLIERHDCWFGTDEMRDVRESWKDIVQVMEQSSTIAEGKDDNEHFCVRGLEGKTCNGKRRRREARAASLELVLDEQIYQEMDVDEGGGVDHIMIAMAYHEFTFPLQVEAYQQAQKDARAVGQKGTNEIKPTKFDFHAVRSKCFSDGKRSPFANADDAAAILMTNALDVHCSRQHNFRRTFSSCFVPLTSKRYARRRQRSSMILTMAKRADI